jgi:hypothetical protein
VTKVATIVAEQREAAARVFSDADSKVLVAWLEKQIRGHQDEMMAQLPETMRDRLEHMGPRERGWSLMFFALSQRGPGAALFQKLATVVRDELRGQLSPQAQAQLDATAGNPEELKGLLIGWVRQSMERHMAQSGPSTRPTDVQLMEFFDRELSEEERNRLVALPREEMMSQLRREYYRRKGLWREGYWRPDGRRPGEGMQGGPNDGDGRPGDGRPGMGGPRPFGQRPGGFGPRPGGGLGPGAGNPGPGNPGGTNPNGGDPNNNPPPNPRPRNAPPPPKPQA